MEIVELIAPSDKIYKMSSENGVSYLRRLKTTTPELWVLVDEQEYYDWLASQSELSEEIDNA